jgi:hypothetical protein
MRKVMTEQRSDTYERGISRAADAAAIISLFPMVIGSAWQWGPGAAVFAGGLWMAIMGAMAIIESRLMAAQP